MSRRGIYFETYSSFSGVFSPFSGAFGPNCRPFFRTILGIISQNFSPTSGVFSPNFSPFLGVFIFLRKLSGKGNAYCK